ncbi:serine hydrolase [Patulibacter sp. SYSU D01012]|uniref:serine hydrolase n=1 Tax=Patulibacter sp. SYSU D01012 TaxID=2817381 RepID=UPI001B3168CE|nr:serine hydrolase [Patulibacter sp. SYSU D01012]
MPRRRVAIPVRPLLLAGALATGASAPASAAPDPLVAAGLPAGAAWRGAVGDTARWAERQPQRIRFALRVEGRAWSHQGAVQEDSNSLLKPTVMVAYLRRPSVRGRALTPGERRLLEPMIRRSANAPVGELLDRLGGLQPLRRVGRLAGMRRFAPVRVVWGRSQITATDEARMFARLPALLPPRHRDYALDLLRTVVPEQRWGVRRAAPTGWDAVFKSGWNGRGHVTQAMRLTCRGRVVTVAVLVTGRSHHDATAAAERAGRRLLQPLRRRGAEACRAVVPA